MYHFLYSLGMRWRLFNMERKITGSGIVCRTRTMWSEFVPTNCRSIKTPGNSLYSMSLLLIDVQ